MNRQNNLKIIITTVIVLIISAIAVFTVVNWSEIVKKFQSAASKADGIEKIDRNTVPPTHTSNTVINNTSEEPKTVLPDFKEDTKTIPNPPTEENTPKKTKDKPKSNIKMNEPSPIGLEEQQPPILNAKDPSNPIKYTGKSDYPMGEESYTDKKNLTTTDKTAKITNGKKYHKRIYKKYKHKRVRFAKVKNLDKRVSFLEKKLGLTKTNNKKKSSLETRIFRLEKFITKKKK